MKWKVVAGAHACGGKVYTQGEVFESDVDMNKHNSVGCIKFVQLDSDTPTPKPTPAPEPEPEEEEGYTRDELAAFTLEELKGIADEAGISVATDATQEQVINAILGE